MKTRKDFLYAAKKAWESLQEVGLETHAAKTKLTIPLDNNCTVQFIWIAPKYPNRITERYKKPLPAVEITK